MATMTSSALTPVGPPRTTGRAAAARSYLSRLGFLHATAPEATTARGTVLPGVNGHLKFTDEHGHTVSAYRRGHNTWVLDHTAHGGGEVLRFYSTRQLVDELNRRIKNPVEVTGALPA